MSDGFHSSQRFVELVSGRWTLQVLAELADHGRRYQELHDALDGISYKVLTESLRRAERDGLICRRIDLTLIETATLYDLTDLGRSITDPLAAMASWADANWEAVVAARGQWNLRREDN